MIVKTLRDLSFPLCYLRNFTLAAPHPLLLLVPSVLLLGYTKKD